MAHFLLLKQQLKGAKMTYDQRIEPALRPLNYRHDTQPVSLPNELSGTSSFFSKASHSISENEKVDSLILESSENAPNNLVENLSSQLSSNRPLTFSFSDLLDVINPLQHIPGISTAYRTITGDDIAPVARVAGSALFFGPIGIASAFANLASESLTGKDIGENLTSLFSNNTTEQADALSNTSGIREETIITEDRMSPQPDKTTFEAQTNVSQLTTESHSPELVDSSHISENPYNDTSNSLDKNPWIETSAGRDVSQSIGTGFLDLWKIQASTENMSQHIYSTNNGHAVQQYNPFFNEDERSYYNMVEQVGWAAATAGEVMARYNHGLKLQTPPINKSIDIKQ